MNYNLSVREEREIFTNQVEWFIANKKEVTLEPFKHTRTNKQNSARWQYLTMCADILNERGETFEAKGLKIDVKFTKDNLYSIYWQTLRDNMYPEKTKQLNTQEFSDLVEMVLMMFAKVFNIVIPFPSWENKTES